MGNIGDYGSHFPILAAAVYRTHGPILEAGCGDWSTPLLHYMSSGERNILSLDNDASWLARFHADYERDWHVFEHVRDWRTHDFLADAHFGVAFVDCSPGEERIQVIQRLRDRADLIIAHDSERDYGTGANYGYEKIRPLFHHVSEWRRYRPYTLILSNFKEFHIEVADRVWNPEVNK